jgi:RecA/RadA recombinase
LSYEDTVKILRSVKGSSHTYVGKKEILAHFTSKRIVTGIPTVDFLTSGGITRGRITILAGNVSSSKCLGKDTPVMMSDGTIKSVQDISIGDLLMGDDKTPRKVLKLHTGEDKLYRVRQSYGDDYIVNAAHILSVKKTQASKAKPKSKGNKIDINIEDYINSTDWFKYNYRGYKESIELPEVDLPIDPYYIGLWLGDGDKHQPRIFTSKLDTQILEYLYEFAASWDLLVSTYKDPRNENGMHCNLSTGSRENIWHGTKNKLLLKMQELNLIKNKHVPDIYKRNSPANLLKLLAGMIDSDGWKDKAKNQLFISNKNLSIIQDMQYIGRSLGFKCVIYSDNINGEIYYKLNICGPGIENIPCLLPRKKADPVSSPKQYLASLLTIEEVGFGEYFGFEIDGNHRFLLGDFTVTHNTTQSFQIVAAAQKLFKSEGLNKMVLWYDAEGAYDAGRAEQLGVDQDYIIIKRSKVIEDVFAEIDDLISTGFIGFLVIDSLDALIPRKVDDSDYGNTMGGASGAVAMHLPKLFNKIMEYDVTSIFIKQCRVKMQVGVPGEVLTFSGGKALRHFADAILMVNRLSNRNLSYVPIKIKAEKTRSSRMGLTLEMPLAEGGIDKVRDSVHLAVEHGMVAQAGAWLSYMDGDDEMRIQGIEKLVTFFRQNPDKFETFYDKVLHKVIYAEDIVGESVDGIVIEDED